jgi:hypothetical protein
MPSLKYADFFNMVRRRILLASEREPVAAGELSSCSSPLADGVPCFFLNPLQPARELLASFCHSFGPIRVVRRARLERPANRILPGAKTRIPRPKVSCVCGRALPDQCREAPPIPSVYVTHLRQKIEADSTKPRLIKTEPGIGYRFEAGEA